MKIKKVIDIDLNTLDHLSLDLGKQIKGSGFMPDHILYVERAGLLIGVVLSDYFKVGISDIISQRMGTKVKSGAKTVLGHLPRWATHFLRRMELASSFHKVNSARRVSWHRALPLEDKKILVVDDAVDTGHSLKAILQFLEAYGVDPANIRIAAVTMTGKYPEVYPDYTLFKEVICAFPWSCDSPEFYLAQQKMANLRALIQGQAVPRPLPQFRPKPVTPMALGLNSF